MALYMHNCYRNMSNLSFSVLHMYITMRESCTKYLYLYVFTEPAQGQSTLSTIVPHRGSAKGGEEFVLLGHKFTSPCK